MTREESIDVLEANYPDSCYELLREAVDTAIEALKQPERKKGKWVFNETLGGWHCSECVATAPFLYMESLQHLSAYCPGCGAPMEVER